MSTCQPGHSCLGRGADHLCRKLRAVTLLEALTGRNRSTADVRAAVDVLFAALPVGRPVAITAEVLDAALAGDRALLATFFAEEEAPEDGDLRKQLGLSN